MKKKQDLLESIPKDYVHNFLLLVSSTAFFFLIIELCIFFILDIKTPGYQGQRFYIPSFLTGYFHRPNAEGYWYRYMDGTKYYVSINSYGFADAPRELEKTRPRIALIGDSTTQFWEAEEGQRGQFQLENLLDQQFEVLNFGVRGYGTDQTYLLYKNVGIHFNPDIVIYTFCINDIFDNSKTKNKPYFSRNKTFPNRLTLRGYPVKFESSGNTDALTFFESFKGYALKSFMIRNAIPILHRFKIWHSPIVSIDEHHDLRPYKKFYNEEDILKLEITLEIIAMLNKFAKESGAKLLLVEGIYRPSLPGVMQDEVMKAYGPIFDFNKITNLLEEFSLKEGIEFLSLPKIVKEKNISVSSLMHKEDSMHLNHNGIFLFSNSILKKLNSLGWVSEMN